MNTAKNTSANRSLWSIAAVVVATGLAAATACGSEATEEDQVRGLIADSIEAENRTYDVICDCHEELGHDSREACLDNQLLPSQRRCVEDAYLADTGASRQYLDCRLPLLGELEDCLDDKLECSDLDPTNKCYDDFDLGLEKCVTLPNAVNRDLEDCYPDGGLAPGLEQAILKDENAASFPAVRRCWGVRRGHAPSVPPRGNWG